MDMRDRQFTISISGQALHDALLALRVCSKPENISKPEVAARFDASRSEIELEVLAYAFDDIADEA
jgi:hypothetical protein